MLRLDREASDLDLDQASAVSFYPLSVHQFLILSFIILFTLPEWPLDFQSDEILLSHFIVAFDHITQAPRSPTLDGYHRSYYLGKKDGVRDGFS